MVEDKSMEVNVQPHGLTIDFRQKVFDMFVKKVIELGQNPTDPDYNNRLRIKALDIEAGIYKKSRNREEYLGMIRNKLNSILDIKRRATTSEDQSTSNVIQTTIVQSNQSAQPIHNASSSLHSFPSSSHPIQPSQMMSMPAAVSPMQQMNSTPMQSTGLHQFQQGRVFERPQNVPLRDTLQHPSVQYSRPIMNERRLSIGGYQQQSRPLISSMGTSFHNTSVQQKSYMPSSPVDVQKFDVCQSQTSPAQTPSSSFLDAGAINAADWKLLMMEHRQARMNYLPELISMLKKAKEDCAKVQGVIQHEKIKNLKNCEQMIRFLQYSESDLTFIAKERICKNLSTITHFFNCMKNQETKLASNEQISVNQLQNTPLVQHAALVSKNAFPQSSFGAQISPLYCPVAPKQIDMQAGLNNGSQGTAEQNSPLNLKRNSESMESSGVDQPPKKQQLRKPKKMPKEKDFMDSMFISSTKPKRGHPRSTKQPPLQKKNTSCVSDPSAMSQNKASMAAVGSAPTPVTPSSVPKEIREPTQSVSPKETEVPVKFASIVRSSGTITSLPVDSAATPITPSSAPKEIRELAQSVSPNEIGAIEAARDNEMQDKSASLVTYGTITTPLPSDGAADSSQAPQSAMLPIDRLVRAVQRVSKDTLKRAVNDMYAAINDMDRLPEYAFFDDYQVYDPLAGYDIEY